MSKTRQDIVLWTGKDVSFTVGPVTGGTFLAGALTWRLSFTPSGTADLIKTEASGIVASDNENCTISIANGDLTEPGVYWHELVQNVAGAIIPICAGRAVVRPSPGS